MVSSAPQDELTVSTQNSPGAPTEDSVHEWIVGETGGVSDRINMCKTNAAHKAQDAHRRHLPRQPQSGALKGYDAVWASVRHQETPHALRSRRGGPGGGGAGGGRYHGDRKLNWRTEGNRTGHAGRKYTRPQGKKERHAAGHNQGEGPRAKQLQSP